MDTQNLSRWIDELQGQISDLRIKVNEPAPVDQNITPFIDVENGAEPVTFAESTEYFTAAVDCALVAYKVTEVDLITATGPVITATDVLFAVYNTSDTLTATVYLKKGQKVSMSGTVSTSKYSIYPLFGGEPLPAPDPTPDVAPAADTRSTKKKK